MKEKVVLAFSGGLDTSFCVPYLINEKGLEVHTVMVNTGGFSKVEEEEIKRMALSLGATSHKNIDVSEEYYSKGIKYLIFGNILKNGTYPLSVSSERVFQALALLEEVKKSGAKYFAHGSTGAGNDQIRFDLVFEVLAPEVNILAPIRELSIGRAEEIAYLLKYGCNLSWEKSKYSINQGLWGTSIGGAETLTANGILPEEAYPSHLDAKDKRRVKIGFLKGEPKSIDGEEMNPINLIKVLSAIASPYAVGRDIHVGDTIIGIKGRVAFEAAAPMIIIKAHQLLEKHTLTKGQLYWKDQLAGWYGQLVHEAQYLDPLARNIEVFLEDTQKNVTGEVEIELIPHHLSILGCSSEYDLMNSKFGQYGEKNSSLSGEDIMGFTRVLANPLKIYYSVHKND